MARILNLGQSLLPTVPGLGNAYVNYMLCPLFVLRNVGGDLRAFSRRSPRSRRFRLAVVSAARRLDGRSVQTRRS
jgi:hypothetical protein